MATQLYVIANATTSNATFTNSDQASDKADVGANTVVHTGGEDGDFCEIPACSESKYFDANHMLVQGEGLNIAFWRDETEENILKYSLNNTYASHSSVAGSNDWKWGTSMMIQRDSAGVHVQFFPY